MWQNHRSLFLVLLVLTAARMVLAATFELSPDEAYYHLWTQHMDWSFYSKGPGVASAIWLGTAVFGDGPFGIRFWSPLCGLGTSLMIYRLGRGLFDGNTAAWSAVLVNVTPIFNAGSILMTIDPPSIFFWTLALVTLWSALHRASPWSLYWVATGLAIGIGFLFKYTNAFLLLGLVLVLVCVPKWRGLWRRPGPWMLLGAFGLCTLPVLIWNAQHGWITLIHLLERGRIGESTGYHIVPLLEYLGLHAGVYSPLVFVGLLWALWVGLRHFGRDAGEAFLICFSAPIVVFYFLLSLKETGEPNWTAPGFVGLLVLLVHAFHKARLSGPWRAGLRVGALGLAVIVSALALNFDLLRKAGASIPYSRDPLLRLRGGQELAQAADQFIRAQHAESGQAPFLIAQRYQLSALLHYYLPADCPVLRPDPSFPRAFIPESPAIRNQFSFWPRYDQRQPGANPVSPYIGRDALFFSDAPSGDSAPTEVEQAFARVEPIGLVEIRRMDLPLRRLRVFSCQGYRGTDL